MVRSTDVPTPVPAGDTELWSGLEEWAGTPEFRDMLHREFPEDATAWTDPVSRRTFLTLAGATAALAGVGCSPRMASREKIYPYTRQPAEMTPGLPLFFATGFTLNGITTGVLAKSREGRPIKLEGNPTHPGSLGGIDSVAQASLLNLYDPDRSRQILNKKNNPTAWEAMVGELKSAVGRMKADGKAIRILTETINSPTMGAVLTEFERTYPTAKVVQWEPAGRDNVREGAKLAFGEPVNIIYDFTKALRVVALDSDFLVSDRSSTRYARDFNQLRRTHLKEGDRVPAENELNRLYAVESMLTATGAVADHRLPIRSADVEGFARALAAAVGLTLPGSAPTVSADQQKWVAAIAKDLQAYKGKSAVIAGDHQSPAVHAIAHAINGALGNVGATVLVTAPIEVRPSSPAADLKTLVAEMNAGSVGALFILGGNPIYTAPTDLKFADALGRVGIKVHLGSHQDETAVVCDWHVNEAHFLETWNDGRAYDGTVSICQPLIAPLFGGRSGIELLSALLSETAELAPREIVKNYWRKNWPANGGSVGGFDAGWQLALRDGVIPGTAAARVDKQPAAAGIPAYVAPSPSMEVNFRADPTVFDGRYANNGWLQELPKQITKLTWDNAIIISPKTAADKNIGEERHGTRGPRIESTGGGEHGRTLADVAELTVNGRTIKGAVWIQPGHADNSVTVHLGYGRERCGKVGKGTGFNAYPLRGSEAPWIAVGGDLKKVDGDYILASTQAHWNMEGRRPVRRATRDEFAKNYAEYVKDPHKTALFAKVPPVAAPEWKSIDENVPGSPNEWKGASAEEHEKKRHAGHAHSHDHDHKKEDGKKEEEHSDEDKRLIPLTMVPDTNKHEARRWAMAIDLTTCIGCSACLAACVAENNIPVVGKKEVTRGREMHWIRVDRYYEGTDPNDAANLVTHFQPVPCQQCEKAPCEVVCPVAATIHSYDGLNDMVYNRCVGTRYCSNNCPYKVRRFNFLTFSDWKTDTYKLMRNPEVTVRERGVMEKCTYCVQRIRGAEIEAERQGREIRDGEILTACQQACPADAIVFGNLSDPKSRVNTWKSQPTNYGLLAELNTMPRTTYLAAVRNPNPELVRA
ncbi:MAG TPA: TAT-variant-translocated molybdopterin oxidoreductase [Gemmataceae bacterium]|jgi:molybdopterin-containing oxidoreductase family iron-sulfur binding subunit|nr:TAT-variant-translocated molybdopterin oxidoreductase [Gemmataceae bacterium]